MSINNQDGNDDDKIETIKDSPKNQSRVTIEYQFNSKKDILGTGYSGNVYRVQKKRNISGQNNPYYALKIFNKIKLFEENDKGARILNEIKIHRSLNHKHICKYEHSFEDKKNVYILMEYCGLGTMANYLKNRKCLEEYEIRYYMFQVLSVLKYLRREKIVHRDLTLGNIFLKDYKTVKIGDFGFAYKESDNDEKTNIICGTPGYFTPESNNSKYSYKTDIFDFGLCIYYLFGGKELFHSSQECAEMFSNNQIEFNKKLKYSSQALDLLNKTVTTENQRIDLDEIYNHPFFNKGKGLSKSSFPEYQENNKEEFLKAIQEKSKDLLLDPIKHEEKKSNIINNNNTSEVANSTDRYPIILHRNNSGHQSAKNVSFINSGNKIIKGGNPIVGSVYKINMKKLESSKISDTFGENVRKSWAKIQIENQLNPKKSSIKKINETNEENKEKNFGNTNEEIDFKNDDNNTLKKDIISDKDNEKDSIDINNLPKKIDNIESNNSTINPKKLIYVTNIIDNLIDCCGIGFLLNNRNIGVYFNDDSQIIKIYDNSKYIYHHFKDYLLNSIKTNKIYFPPKDITSNMKKKINYLIYVIEEFVKSNKIKDKKKWKFNSNFTNNNNENEEENNIHLEKYKKTKNAYIFVFSNKNIQVYFFDKIKIIFTCYEPKKITYINRNDEITYFPVKDHFSDYRCEDKEIKKRIDCAIKEINK